MKALAVARLAVAGLAVAGLSAAILASCTPKRFVLHPHTEEREVISHFGPPDTVIRSHGQRILVYLPKHAKLPQLQISQDIHGNDYLAVPTQLGRDFPHRQFTVRDGYVMFEEAIGMDEEGEE